MNPYFCFALLTDVTALYKSWQFNAFYRPIDLLVCYVN